MNYSPKKEQGLTLVSIVILLVFVCMMIVLALKIVPIYMNHGKVKSAIEAVKNLPGAKTKTKTAIRASIDKRFGINYVEGLPSDAVKIKKHGEYIKITVKYDIKKPIIANLNVLVEFDEFVEIGEK